VEDLRKKHDSVLRSPLIGKMFPEISDETARLDLNTLLRKRLLNKCVKEPSPVTLKCDKKPSLDSYLVP